MVEPSQLLQEQLRVFRAAHTPRTQQRAGHAWEVVRAGESGPRILLLPGALGTAESAMGLIAEMARGAQVMAVSYPPIPTMKELVDGVAEVMAAEGWTQAHVLGGSYGGMVAQAFSAEHPELVKTLILTHTGPPDARLGQRLRRAVNFSKLVPPGFLRWMIEAKIVSMLRGTGQERFWKGYMAERMAGLSKQELLAPYSRVIEFCVDDLCDGDCGLEVLETPHPVFVLESDDDEIITPAQRAALRGRYPKAETHVFRGAGHLVTLTRREEFVRLVLDFITRNQ